VGARLLVIVLSVGAWRVAMSTATAHPRDEAPAGEEAQAEEHGETKTQEPDELGEEEEYRNGFGFGYAHSFHLLKDRQSADGSELPNREHLWGFIILYERILIENWLTLNIAKPLLFNRERFDSPLDIVLKGIYRKNEWEPFIGAGISSNIRVFKREREEAEGKGIEHSFGIVVAVGFTYFIRRHWGIEFELGYVFIPDSDTFEHEFSNVLAAAYYF
jgi:hypothetical protein